MTSRPELPDDDREAAAIIVQQLKSQGMFDAMRRECLADLDTKSAFTNLTQRIQTYVSRFLERQEWNQDLNKNQLRERLRRNLTESEMMKYGVKHLVDGAVQSKQRTFVPEIEKVVRDMLGIEDDADWPETDEINSEPDINMSQEDMEVSSEDENGSNKKIESFVSSFTEVDTSSQDSSPAPSVSLIQQLFEPTPVKTTPTKISILLSSTKSESVESEPPPHVIEKDQVVEDKKPPVPQLDEIELPPLPPPKVEPLESQAEDMDIEESSNECPAQEEIPVVETPSLVKIEPAAPEEKPKEEPPPPQVKIEKEEKVQEPPPLKSIKEKSKPVAQNKPKEIPKIQVKPEPLEVVPAELLSDVSSVHTSDLSDFDDQISVSSGDEANEEKKKVALKDVKKITSKAQNEKELEKPKERRGSAGRRERKINPKYASEEYSSMFNRGQKSKIFEEDISSEEDFEVASKSSTPLQDEVNIDIPATPAESSTNEQEDGEIKSPDEAESEKTATTSKTTRKKRPNKRQERYDASDLYKPRPMIGSSRRSRTANPDNQ